MISSADVMLCAGCAAFCFAILKSQPLSQFILSHTFTLLTCAAIICDEPQSPANGDKVTTGRSVGNTVSYFCNPGFKLSGDQNRTCQPDEQWSGSQPNCSRECNGLDNYNLQLSTPLKYNTSGIQG